MGGLQSALRTFAETFPPLKVALYINDVVCYLFGKLVDAIKYVATQALKLLWYLFGLTLSLVRRACSWLLGGLLRIRFIRKLTERRPYKQLALVDPGGPIPYANNLLKRLFTYHGGLLLALALYVFVYFVLVGRHTYANILIALLALLVYLLLVENSHTFRSVLMLSLPIMLTNRGRALVYCSMLAIMTAGPIWTLKHNVGEIHSSLACCKQYLIVSSDKHLDENYVKRLVKVEDVVRDLVENVKQYARDLKEEFATIIRLALACEQFILDALDSLKDIVDVCNTHSNDAYQNCASRMSNIKQSCRLLFNPFRSSLCDLIGDTSKICSPIRLPDRLCQLPVKVVDYIERTVGAKLKQYIRVIENELYVDIDIERKYSYNLTKSKAYSQVAAEVKFDVEQEFWFIPIIGRLFHFITLALVVFILATATAYHMHYQRELAFDNMYLDESLLEIDAARRQVRVKSRAAAQANPGPLVVETARLISIEDEDEDEDEADREGASSNVETGRANLASNEQRMEDDERWIEEEFDPFGSPTGLGIRPNEQLASAGGIDQSGGTTVVDDLQQLADQELGLDRQPTPEQQKDHLRDEPSAKLKKSSLFPLSQRHERHYLRPYSLTMNHAERSKLKWSSVVWLIIIGYIWFFVALDYAFFWLVSLLVEILRDILFASDLPLVDLETQSSGAGNDTLIRYNRTYLAELKRQRVHKLQLINATEIAGRNVSEPSRHTNSSVAAFYRRLMDSIERDIPDDVAILDSLEGCLPKAHAPIYRTYRKLLYLALFTFVAVIVEAYALRTRHCIANLYYPDRARERANWLYRKLKAERVEFTDDPSEQEISKLKPEQDSNRAVPSSDNGLPSPPLATAIADFQ